MKNPEYVMRVRSDNDEFRLQCRLLDMLKLCKVFIEEIPAKEFEEYGGSAQFFCDLVDLINKAEGNE